MNYGPAFLIVAIILLLTSLSRHSTDQHKGNVLITFCGLLFLFIGMGLL